MSIVRHVRHLKILANHISYRQHSLINSTSVLQILNAPRISANYSYQPQHYSNTCNAKVTASLSRKLHSSAQLLGPFQSLSWLTAAARHRGLIECTANTKAMTLNYTQLRAFNKQSDGRPVQRQLPQESDPVVQAEFKEDRRPQGSAAKIKQLVKDYGPIAMVVHVSLSLMSLGGCYLAVDYGVPLNLATDWAFGGGSIENIDTSAVATGGSFVIAYAVHKAMMPIRLFLTATITPALVNTFRKRGWMKKP